MKLSVVNISQPAIPQQPILEERSYLHQFSQLECPALTLELQARIIQLFHANRMYFIT